MQIVIADDHPIVAQAIKTILEAADPSTDVIVHTRITDLMTALNEGPPPDFVLIDYCMPDAPDGSAIFEIRDRYPHLRLGIISGQEDMDLVRKVMAAGALGFIPKSMAPEAMVHAIWVMAAGGHYLPWPIMMQDSAAAPAGSRVVTGDSLPGEAPGAALTDREREVLDELVRGLSNKEIGTNLGIAEVTVKLHLRRLYKKINVSNRASAVRFALENRSLNNPA